MKKARKRQLSLVAVASLLLALVAAVVAFPAVPVCADEDVEAEDGLVYVWYNETVRYGGRNHWERFEYDGPPHSYNQNEDNWWIPEANRDDPYPYGATVRTRTMERSFYYFNTSDLTDDSTGTWTPYDPEGGSHPANDVLPEGDARREWSHPYWARTTSTEEGAPKPIGYWAATESNEDWYEEPEDETPAVAPEDDPFGELGAYIDALDKWFVDLSKEWGVPNPFGDGIRNFFTKPP